MKCDGSCKEHSGDVKLAHIYYGGHDWGQFNYCDNAIKEDEARGLTVEVLNDQTNTP